MGSADCLDVSWDFFDDAISQAKQMEKEQIEKAYEQGTLDGYEPNYGSGKQYYNDTYGEAISKIGNSDLSQTALQRLIEWAESLKHNTQQCTDWICIKEKAEGLLQLEREQAFQMFKAGQDSMEDGGMGFDQYYAATYGVQFDDSENNQSI